MKALKCTHNGKGFTGHIVDEEMYEAVKREEKDWKPHIKKQLTQVTIPFGVFQRLLELDRRATAEETTRAEEE